MILHQRRSLTCRIAPACFLAACLAPALRGDEPIPLQRVLVAPERVPAELDKVQRGALIQMPRAEFETRVATAFKAAETAKNPPRLLRSSYSGELNEHALSGSGQWLVMHSAQGPGILPLPSLNLALRHVKWDQGDQAILGALDGQHLGLFVAEPGTASCFFDWSSRATPAAGGLNFDLQLPLCPLLLLELKLPLEHWLVAARQTGVLITGPHESGVADKQLWRIQVTGLSRLELSVRRLSDAALTPRLFAQIQARQLLTPDRVLADWDLQVEALQASPRELILEGDSDLQPYDVSARGGEVAGWNWQPGASLKDAPDKKSPGLLTLKLREPLRGTLPSLKVRALAPRPSAQSWRSPLLRLRQAVVRNETLRLHIHPDLQLGTWDPGDFRLTGAETETDGTHILTLVDPRTSDAASRRPQGELRAQGTDLRTRQRSRWHLGAGGMELSTEVAFDLARGTLHRLVLKLPAAVQRFQVESVELLPRDQLRGWVIAGPLLLVDLQRGLTPRSSATLKVRLRAPEARFDTRARTLDFPEIEPVGAVVREGSLEVSADAVFQTKLLQSSLPPAAASSVEAGPGLPCFAFAYRGRAVTGQVLIVPQRARLRVRSEQEVLLEARAGTWKARLELEPSIGQPDLLDLYLSRPFLGPLQASTDDPKAVVTQVRRLPVAEVLPHLLGLTAAAGVEQAALALAVPRGQLWRVQLAERLQKKVTLTLEAALPGNELETVLRRLPLPISADPWPLLAQVAAGPLPDTSAAERRWELPLVTGRDIDEFDGEVLVRSGELRIVKASPAGLGTVGAARSPGDTEQRYTYRGIGSGHSTDLVLWTRPRERVPAGEAVCDDVRLTTFVATDGTLHHHLCFRLLNWRQPTCALTLPPSAGVLAARVDGYWLPGLASADDRLTLPINSAARHGNRIEVLYEAPPAERSSLGLVPLDAPEPLLPAPSLGVQRTWRLAPGLWPMRPEMLRGVADMAPASVLASLRELWHLGESTFGPWSDARHVQLTSQQNVVVEAGKRQKLSPQTRLGEALERLDLNFLKAAAPLVLDQAALAEAGLHPDLLLGPLGSDSGAHPFWEALGLAYVPCPRGALLTTTAQLRRCREFGIDAPALGLRLSTAVDEALEQGVDRSGAIVSLARWLRTAPPHDRTATDIPALLLVEQGGAGWTHWDSLPGLTVDGPLWAVSVAPWCVAGWLFAVGVLVLAWARARWFSSVWGFRAHVLALMFLGLVALALPTTLRHLAAGPPLLAGLASLFWYILLPPAPAPVGRPARSTMIRSASSASLVLLALGGVSWLSAQTSGPAPHWIYLIGAEEPDKQLALITPDLLKQLKELEARTPATSGGAVVVGAHYQAKIRQQAADFEVEYEVFSFRDRADLALPLHGIQLKDGAFLDGAPAFPVADRSGLGFTQPVKGKGSHVLRLAFSARATAVADQHELAFTIPRLPQSHLDVTWLTPVSGQEVVHCQGEVNIPYDGKRPRPELSAQLGGEGTLKLRWLAGPGQPPDNRVDVREAYFWDLRPGAVSLGALLHYGIPRGGLGQFQVLLPDGLEVRAVEVAGPSTPVVKGWHVAVKDGQRQLRVELLRPATGFLSCNLDLLPRLALATDEQLRLPLPLSTKTIEGFVGYRLEASTAGDRFQNLAVTSLAPERFSKEWVKLAGRELPGVTRAFSFVRTGAQSALNLALQPLRPRGDLDTSWVIHPQHAEFSTRAVLSGAESILVQARIPKGMTVVDVQGDKLHHWNLQDSLLQVWLTQPRKQVTLDITGWVDHAGGPAPKRRVVLPCLELLQVQPGTNRVAVRAEVGLRVEPEHLKNLRPSAGGEPLVYDATGPAEAAFTISTVPAVPDARLLTTLQLRQEEVELRGYLHLTVPHDLPAVKLVVADWPGEVLRLDVSAPVLQRTRVSRGTRHEWNLVFGRGLPSHILLTLHGRVKAQRGQKIALPEVRLDPGLLRAHWVAARDLEPVVPGPGVREAKPPPDSWLFGPAAERALKEGTLWQLATPTTRCVVQVPSLPPASQVQVLLAREEAALVEPTRWLHQGRYLVHARGQAELRLVLPPGARWLAAAVDDAPVLPSTHVPGELSFALPATSGARVVEVRWDFPDSKSAAVPEHAVPQLPGAELLTRQACLYMPADQQRAGRPPSPNALEAGSLYALAQAHLRETALLAPARDDVAKAALLAAQQRFYEALRHLEQALSWQAAGHERDAPGPLLKKTNELRQENLALAKKLDYEALRKKADDAPWAVSNRRSAFAPLPGGTPLDYEAGTPRLVSTFDAAATEKRILAELLLLAGVSLLLVSYLRHGLTLVQLLGPVLVAFLVTLGILAWGATMLGIAVLLIAGATWVLVCVRHLRHLLARWAVQQDQADVAGPA